MVRGLGGEMRNQEVSREQVWRMNETKLSILVPTELGISM